MGCGCGKNRNKVIAAPTATQLAQDAARTGNVVMYDVIEPDGSLVASFSNPVSARAAAREVTGRTTVPRKAMASTTATVNGTQDSAVMVAAVGSTTPNQEGATHAQ